MAMKARALAGLASTYGIKTYTIGLGSNGKINEDNSITR